MDGLFWSSTAEGIDDLEAFFDYAGYKARDMREPLGDAKDHIQNTMSLQFITEGDYRSGGWVPLTEEYELRKEREFGPEPILVRKHYMKNSVLSDASWFVGLTEAEFAPVGPHAELADYHQDGAERSRGGFLPARPILELNESDYTFIEEAFWEWLDELRSANIQRGVPDIALRPPVFS